MKKVRWLAERVIKTQHGPYRVYARMGRSEVIVRVEHDGDTTKYMEWGMPKILGLVTSMEQAAIQTTPEQIVP